MRRKKRKGERILMMEWEKMTRKNVEGGRRGKKTKLTARKKQKIKRRRKTKERER